MSHLKTNTNNNITHINFFTKTKWGDYDDNKVEDISEDKNEVKNKVEDKVEDKVVNKVDDKVEDKVEDKVVNKVVNKVQYWETKSSPELFKKIVKKYNKKQNIPIVYELNEFITCLKSKKKPNIDFIIDISAHCEHTYKGTLCKNIKNCNKIHIQRCTNGESCKNKQCTYVHLHNMPDEKSRKNFEKTINAYNKIKPNKKVIT